MLRQYWAKAAKRIVGLGVFLRYLMAAEGRDLWNLRALDFTSLELIMGNIMCKWAVCPSFRLNICRLYSMAEPKINYLPR